MDDETMERRCHDARAAFQRIMQTLPSQTRHLVAGPAATVSTFLTDIAEWSSQPDTQTTDEPPPAKPAAKEKPNGGHTGKPRKA